MQGDTTPRGSARLGFTKPDKAQKGLRARIEGKNPSDVTLALGYIAVKCRNTDDDAEMAMTHKEMTAAERDWFPSHSELRGCQQVGIPALAARLDEIQRDLLLSSDVLSRLTQQVREALEEATEKEKALLATILNEGDAVQHTLQALTTVGTHLEALQVK